MNYTVRRAIDFVITQVTRTPFIRCFLALVFHEMKSIPNVRDISEASNTNNKTHTALTACLCIAAMV